MSKRHSKENKGSAGPPEKYIFFEAKKGLQKGSQEAPKRPPRGSKKAPQGPKTAQKGPVRHQNGPMRLKKSLKTALGPVKTAEKGLFGHTKGSKRARGGPRWPVLGRFGSIFGRFGAVFGLFRKFRPLSWGLGWPLGPPLVLGRLTLVWVVGLSVSARACVRLPSAAYACRALAPLATSPSLATCFHSALKSNALPVHCQHRFS